MASHAHAADSPRFCLGRALSAGVVCLHPFCAKMGWGLGCLDRGQEGSEGCMGQIRALGEQALTSPVILPLFLRRDRMSSSVDFPAPLGPRSARHSPG